MERLKKPCEEESPRSGALAVERPLASSSEEQPDEEDEEEDMSQEQNCSSCAGSCLMISCWSGHMGSLGGARVFTSLEVSEFSKGSLEFSLLMISLFKKLTFIL